MNNTNGFSIQKPVSMWNKPLNANFKDLFKSLGKALIDGFTGQWKDLAGDTIDIVASLSLDEEIGEIAWLLVFRSLSSAMYNLIKDNRQLFWNFPDDDSQTILDISKVLENTEIVINQEFFNNPKESPFLDIIKPQLKMWLLNYSLSETQAQSICNRLPTYFLFALHNEWCKRSKDYNKLTDINTPFTKAVERERSWMMYSTWLQKKVEESLFDEAFSLRSIYIPLRAYYEVEKSKQKSNRENEKEYHRVVVDLECELENWLDRNEQNDSVRFICGGPGSGKSSFVKMFAAKQSEQLERHVLFIPLHMIDMANDLIEAVGTFVQSDIFLNHNPLSYTDGDNDLLVIFDGLDELSMQGRVGIEIALDFVNKVESLATMFNRQIPRLKVLITGRELSVQHATLRFTKKEKVLNMIPYVVSDESIKNNVYIDESALLQKDQRIDWWIKYGEVTGKPYHSIPKELSLQNLVEITSYPLLNYLVACTYKSKRIMITEQTNLNEIYFDLLKEVHERRWAGYHHPAIRDINEKSFIRVLEEIAVATWHGASRTTTIAKVKERCEKSQLTPVFEDFQEGVANGITRILAAFYFKQSGMHSGSEMSFEFTHKSFREYLTARRIVSAIENICIEREQNAIDADRGWDERKALEYWLSLCGYATIDTYLFRFISNEINLRDVSQVTNWQNELVRLINFILHKGMPVDRLHPRPDYHDELRIASNGETSLLSVLSICSHYTEQISKIAWPTKLSLCNWLSLLYSQDYETYAKMYLNNFDIKSCIMQCSDLNGANFNDSNLRDVGFNLVTLIGSSFERADLSNAIFVNSCLEEVNFYKANLTKVFLTQTNLQDALLEGAILIRADLSYSDLEDADLSAANLAEAKFIGANLSDAYLVRSHAEKADFEKANLCGADLRLANFKNSNLKNANLSEIDGQGADFSNADLTGADFTKANLEGADFEGAKLDGAILKQASIKGVRNANFEGVIFQ